MSNTIKHQTINTIIANGVIFEEELQQSNLSADYFLSSEDLEKNNILTVFSKTCDNDILVTIQYLTDNNIDRYSNDLYYLLKNELYS